MRGKLFTEWNIKNPELLRNQGQSNTTSYADLNIEEGCKDEEDIYNENDFEEPASGIEDERENSESEVWMAHQPDVNEQEDISRKNKIVLPKEASVIRYQ